MREIFFEKTKRNTWISNTETNAIRKKEFDIIKNLEFLDL